MVDLSESDLGVVVVVGYLLMRNPRRKEGKPQQAELHYLLPVFFCIRSFFFICIGTSMVSELRGGEVYVTEVVRPFFVQKSESG